MTKKYFLLLVVLLTQKILLAQAAYDSSYHFYYYDQKLSMFENMADQEKEIVWLGDSITDGCEWSEFFPGKKTLNRGISSDITYGVINRIREVTKRKPAKVFILIGINDIARNIPDSIIIYNYKRIIDSIQLQSPRTKVYFQSLLPTNNAFTNFKNHQNKTDHVLYVNSELKKLCNSKKITFVNLYDAFKDGDGKLDKKYTNDGLHLTGEGYLNWKNLILKNKYL